MRLSRLYQSRPQTMDIQGFHRFRDLPRELQLHIWDIYEANRPCARHYFRSMVHLSGCLYGAAEHDHPWQPWPHRPATAQDPDRTEVPDRALTADSKILLLSNQGARDDHGKAVFVYDEQEPLSALSFRRIWSYAQEPQSYHRWVNFKLDTFCFTNARRSGDTHNLLDYWQVQSGNYPATGRLEEACWFFRIQKLDLLVTSQQSHLGEFDRQILARHPSVKTVTIVPTIHQLTCDHLSLDVLDEHDVVHEVERIPLPKFAALLAATTEPCDCSTPRETLISLQAMKQELVDLISDQDRRVDVRVDVEVYWAKRPDIDTLIAGAGKEKGEDRPAEAASGQNSTQ